MTKAVPFCHQAGAVTVAGAGTNLADFTYVGNVVHGLLLAADHLDAHAVCNGKAYFVTNNERVYFWGFISTVRLSASAPSIVCVTVFCFTAPADNPQVRLPALPYSCSNLGRQFLSSPLHSLVALSSHTANHALHPAHNMTPVWTRLFTRWAWRHRKRLFLARGLPQLL